MPKCPLSEMALHSLKTLADSYDILIDAAQKMEKNELPPDGQKRRAWRRAEQVGRAIDNLMANWEQETCPAVFYSCAWEQCQRNLSVINSLTPFNRWECPWLVQLAQNQQNNQPPNPPPDSEQAPS